MTAEPIAEVIADIRAGRVRHHGTGLLFGKLAGKFWRPAHARGTGEAEPRDYVLKPGNAT